MKTTQDLRATVKACREAGTGEPWTTAVERLLAEYDEERKRAADLEQIIDLQKALRRVHAPTGHTHDLKTWCEYFEAVSDGRKTFEVRRNDRDFHVGDVLHLREWDRTTEQYTGRGVRRVVTYVLRGPAFGVEFGFAVLGIERE